MRRINWTNPINWKHGLNKGLEAWWLNTPMVNGGTILRDLTSNKFHGTLTDMNPATDWVQATDRPGGFGHLDYDGVDGDVDIGVIGTNHRLQFAAGSPTIMSWVIQDSSSPQFQRVVDKSTLQNGVNGYATIIDNGVDYAMAVGNAFSDVSGPSCLGTWRHVTWVFNNGGDGAIYVDGKALATNLSVLDIPSASANMRIGAWQHTDARNWLGGIDDTRIYNRPLNASEILNYYQLSKTGYHGIFNRSRRVVQAPSGGGQLVNRGLVDSSLARGRLVA